MESTFLPVASEALPKAKSAHLSYRPDIDGLRAIAVVSVILYHLNALRGGFVGVDVFFVISGFLITSLLWKEIQQTGTVSLIAFYDRRIRRIFPALIAMFAVTWVVGYRYLFPNEFMAFARSLLAALLSVANIFFWRESGYFAAAASSKPLLHTWSLGVEEQFYVFFPPLLALLYKLSAKHLKTILTVLAVLSFALCVVLTKRAPDAAFYLPVTRAWQLLFGSLLALSSLSVLRDRMARNVTALLGLLMLGYTLFRFSNATPFPGYMALLPTLGAAMLIAAGSNGTTLVGKVLSFKPFVCIGLISYSLYLWHWPLIVFADHGLPIRFGLPSVKYSILVLSFVFGFLSWRFVERPFRRARKVSHTFSYAALATVCIAALVAATLGTKGFVSRFAPRVLKIAAYRDDTADQVQKTFRVGTCFIANSGKFKDYKQDACLALDPSRKNVLLFGDSHAAMLYQALHETYPDVAFQQATASGCLPVVGAGQRSNARGGCRDVIDFTLKQWLPAHHVDYVVIAANWQPGDMAKMDRTIKYLKDLGQSPVLVGPPTEYDMPLPTLLALSMQKQQPAMLDQHRLKAMGAIDAYGAKAAAETWNVPYLSIYNVVCPAGQCMTLFPGDIPVQVDADHLSLPASQYVAQAWKTSGSAPWSHS